LTRENALRENIAMMQMTQQAHLPPLILHPFSGGNGVEDLVEGSRASMALQGLIEAKEDAGILQQRMLLGRFQEIRMLLFLGKDIRRWLQQCAESRQDAAEGGSRRITEQSFAALIVEDPPECVRKKLEGWGVTDRRAVFSRAIGIHSIFQEPPSLECLSPVFLKNYHRFADHAYICFQHLEPFFALDSKNFQFEIYASEEYSRLLSDQWQ
jgi:hypothetical protein